MVELLTYGLLAALGTAISLAVKQHYMIKEQRDRLAFEEICRAAVRAKVTRIEENDPEGLEEEFVDGVDELMAELMKEGYGEAPEEMRAAYLAGGNEVELEDLEP